MSAPGLKITNFHYSHMTFPQNQPFVEYPKWIHMSGYPSALAKDAEAEAQLLARPPIAGNVTVALQPAVMEAAAQVIGEAPSNILVGRNDEREILLQIAREKGVKVDARWKTDRIRSALDKAVG